MAKLRGTGMAAVNYPTGMNLGGDPSQALIHATTTGNFVISLSSTDLGQGLKTVIAQIGAEALGVPFENVMIDTADTDTGPHCMGTFASRATHRVGNAVIQAAHEARKAMLEVAGYPSFVARDGREAISLLRMHAREIALVLLDFHMPGENTAEVYDEFERVAPQVPVLLMSGEPEEMALSRFGRAGLAGFLYKPQGIPRWLEAIERLVGKPPDR